MNLKEVEEYALAKLKQHGLLKKGWTFAFNQATSYVGICYYTSKRVEISNLYATYAKDKDVKETILHEIAHALSPNAKHGPVWQAKAREIGCTNISSRADNSEFTPEYLAALKKKVKYVITVEGKEVVCTYMRRPNKRTVDTMPNRWIPGRKAETMGRLQLEEYNPMKHNLDGVI